MESARASHRVTARGPLASPWLYAAHRFSVLSALELRHKGIVERAAILYRGKRAMVAVANVSKGGVTIETGLSPEVGEPVLLELPGKDPAEAKVRWVKPGRVGLALIG